MYVYVQPGRRGGSDSTGDRDEHAGGPAEGRGKEVGTPKIGSHVGFFYGIVYVKLNLAGPVRPLRKVEMRSGPDKDPLTNSFDSSTTGGNFKTELVTVSQSRRTT